MKLHTWLNKGSRKAGLSFLLGGVSIFLIAYAIYPKTLESCLFLLEFVVAPSLAASLLISMLKRDNEFTCWLCGIICSIVAIIAVDFLYHLSSDRATFGPFFMYLVFGLPSLLASLVMRFLIGALDVVLRQWRS